MTATSDGSKLQNSKLFWFFAKLISTISAAVLRVCYRRLLDTGETLNTDPGSIKQLANKFVSPWVVVIYLLRSGRLLSVCIANRSHCRILNLIYDSLDATVIL